MSAQSLLEQLLKSGMSALGGGASGTSGVPSAPGARPAGGSDWGKYATGAAAGGALGLLLGTKRGRNVGGKALKYGSAAALGAFAFKVYQDWQARQAAAPAAGAATAASRPAPPSFAALPAPQVEQHSQAMLKAMIAAAKADGHMDERERDLVEAELHRLEADPSLRRWVDDELRRPVDPADVARSAASPEMGAEIYLASLLVVDETTVMERAYLDELARQLRLDPGLRAELESRAAA
ncbi:MAG: tellurite resistance TerB family protein [Rubrivivax sp.]|jgi:uncharacterized membrane protein YebE (DUF533 family)|nr:tellurite resistance TerB family protein [Rubrivivax sp.]